MNSSGHKTGKIVCTKKNNPVLIFPKVEMTCMKILKPRQRQGLATVVSGAILLTAVSLMGSMGSLLCSTPSSIQKVTTPSSIQKVTTPSSIQKVTTPSSMQKVTDCLLYF